MDIRSLNKLKFNIIYDGKFFVNWFPQRFYSTQDHVRVRFAPSPTGKKLRYYLKNLHYVYVFRVVLSQTQAPSP